MKDPNSEVVSEGFQDFDVAIATPPALWQGAELGKVLGRPRGANAESADRNGHRLPAKALRGMKSGSHRVFKLEQRQRGGRRPEEFSFEEIPCGNVNAVIEQCFERVPPAPKGGP